MIKSIFIALLTLIIGAPFTMQAQTRTQPGKTEIAIETDPSTFAFKGYALHFRIKPKQSRHLMLGAGVYALDMPDFLVDMNKENKAQGWNVRINHAYALFGEYYFKEAGSKWFAGLQTGVQQFKISNVETGSQTSQYNNLLVMPSIGYNWHPFRFPLYIKPWAGIGYTTKLSGENNVATREYNIAPLSSFVTLHVGYRF